MTSTTSSKAAEGGAGHFRLLEASLALARRQLAEQASLLGDAQQRVCDRTGRHMHSPTADHLVCTPLTPDCLALALPRRWRVWSVRNGSCEVLSEQMGTRNQPKRCH
eukprot:scaffold256529_cov28-Tisochrysis_lutea.AAC.4